MPRHGLKHCHVAVSANAPMPGLLHATQVLQPGAHDYFQWLASGAFSASTGGFSHGYPAGRRLSHVRYSKGMAGIRRRAEKEEGEGGRRQQIE
eukprot:scaffold225899_cov19-Tisochrysis_lutea.AAC.1